MYAISTKKTMAQFTPTSPNYELCYGLAGRYNMPCTRFCYEQYLIATRNVPGPVQDTWCKHEQAVPMSLYV